jgi:hypothetical protein
MDDLRRFCVRMLGDGPEARAAEERARATGDGDPVAALGEAVAAWRELGGPAPGAPAGEDPGPGEPAGKDRGGLAAAVARELRAATDRLPAPEREALALRDLLGLSYDEVARVAGLDPDAVAPLLARGRTHLRAQLRGASAPVPDCPEHERGLRTIALRQDGQPVAPADDDWLIEHLGHCRACGQAHAAMLEASACYRAWSPDSEPAVTGGAPARAPNAAGP